jgi:hypothetical protein
MTDSLLGELLLLRRAGTVDDYTDQFLTLTCSDADLSDRQLVQIYTAGLTNPLKTKDGNGYPKPEYPTGFTR